MRPLYVCTRVLASAKLADEKATILTSKVGRTLYC
jgi:hypothetical protein